MYYGSFSMMDVDRMTPYDRIWHHNQLADIKKEENRKRK